MALDAELYAVAGQEMAEALTPDVLKLLVSGQLQMHPAVACSSCITVNVKCCISSSTSWHAVPVLCEQSADADGDNLTSIS